MDIFRTMAALIEYPWLALAPAAAFFCLYVLSKSRLSAVAAGLWLAYAGYEYAMTLRLLCSGECNIRIDLFVIYPGLLLVSLASLIAFAMRGRRKT
jgi:hypothetical protein